MDLSFILLLAAFIVFVISAFGVASHVNLQSVGLALATLAFILSGGSIG